jgi:proline dehydrogenase
LDDAIVADMGGTTTDIAVVRGGLPALRHALEKGGLPATDLASWDGTAARVAAIADACAAHAAFTRGGLRLILDAEQTWVQPAIDGLAVALMARHNAPGSAFSILQTYQHNLVATPARLAADAARAEREGWVLGAKPVRGAYLVAERARAAAAGGSQDPTCPTIEATHRAYDNAVARLVPAAAAGSAHLMVATHNQASVEGTVAAMSSAGLAPTSPAVLFGQLFGMRDFLTLTLGATGFRAYKILPYGPLREVLLYLTRRAQENADVLGNVGVDLALLRAELERRVGFWSRG